MEFILFVALIVVSFNGGITVTIGDINIGNSSRDKDK